MSSFPHGIYHINDGIMSMCIQKFTDEVYTDDVPTVLQSGEQMKLSGWAASLNLCPETDVTCPHILTNVYQHLWPPVAPGDKLQGFPAFRVACNLGVAM
jgi:hypothetical protein